LEHAKKEDIDVVNLSAKYAKLKKLVGGNREITEFENTFGMPKEEQQRITPVNKWIRRILSEIEFSIRLSAEQAHEFDDSILAALNVLEEGMNTEGVISKTAAFAAEEKLAPIAKAAKEYKLILAAHAHIDMNWMWGWHETVAATLATFRTMLYLMDEYPEFHFSQSQASVYKIVQDYDPELMEQIKKRIKEGRWEITATAWVETDKNMPSTESLLRHIKYTRDYLQKHWDIDPASLEIDFSPDTFGHSANIPEIDDYGDVKYMYHCRGLDGDNALYRWRGQSGREILVYREQYWYNSGITPQAGIGIVDISKRCSGLKTGLIVYGVGDHGGGPTRRDIERAIEMNQWPIFPQMKFGTIREFFKEAETVRDMLPVVHRELNYFAPGCYTTQSRIKRGNRRSEAALIDAEAFSALAKIQTGKPFMADQFENAWQNVLFTHFHDILTGSCVQDSREHAMGLYTNAMAVANTQHTNAINALAAQIDSSMIVIEEDEEVILSSQAEGAGAGYGLMHYTGVPSPERGVGRTRVFNVFNPSANERQELVEITVWDWTGDMRFIRMEDFTGQPLDFLLLNKNLEVYWDHRYFKILVRVKVPAFGYTTVVLREVEPEEYPVYYHKDGTSHTTENPVLENEFIRAEFSCETGALLSLIDKQHGSELIRKDEYAGLSVIFTESASSNAWQIGKYLRKQPVDNLVKFTVFAKNKLRQGFSMEAKVLGSTIRTEVTLDCNSKALAFNATVDWNEVGGEQVPVLVYNIPLAYEAQGYLCDIPAGSIIREQRNGDIPALQYVSARRKEGNSISIVTDSKYGYRGYDNNLTSTLINTSTSPDPYPERGIHNIKLFVTVAPADAKGMEVLASDLNHPMSYVSTNPHKGTLPPEQSLLKVSGGSAVVSSVSSSSDGGLLVRLYETCGKNTSVQVEFSKRVKTAVYVDLGEKELPGHIVIEDKIVQLQVQAYSIAAVKLGF
jgi:alpha-mannosidase